MVYNMTAFETCTSLFCSFQAVNTLSTGILVNFGLITLFVILLLVLMRYNPPAESFTASSGAVAVVSLLCLALDLLDVVWVIGFTMLFAISAVGLYLRNKTT